MVVDTSKSKSITAIYWTTCMSVLLHQGTAPPYTPYLKQQKKHY